MDIMNCKECKRLFNYLSGPKLCPDCARKLEDKFQQVKEYIRSNPHSNMAKISEENDVSMNQLRQWIREERLALDKDCVIGIECENCGKPICTGRFCDTCKTKVANNLMSVLPKQVKAAPQKKSRDKERMRFLDK